MTLKKKIITGSVLGIILLIVFYFIFNLYLNPDNFVRQIYLIPKDAIYIVETDDPINNWKKFAKSKPWGLLKNQKKMEEIGEMAQTLDSVLNANKTLLGLLGKRNLMISAHMTRKSDYDFLFVIDLQKTSKLESLKTQMENLFKLGDYRVTTRKYKGERLLELYDPEDKSTLYMAFVGNHLVCSFTGLLVEKSIDEINEPSIGRDLLFLDIDQKVEDRGLCKLYINYNHLTNYLSFMTGIPARDLEDICKFMGYTGLEFDASDKMFSLKGYTNLNDTVDYSYLPALMQSGNNKIGVHKILSHRTAFFLSMGFDNPTKFMENLEYAMKQDEEVYKDFRKNWDFIENFLKIDIKENFLDWMEGEVVFAQNVQGSLGRQNEFVAAIKIKNKKEAEKNLDFIEERIRKRTPVKFRTIEYEGYDIHYLEMKGFFRLLFGKIFNRLDKPYYTIIDDYAVFSNSTATLLSMIEDYRQGQTLDKDKEFTKFLNGFNKKSTVFAYTNTHKFFPLMREFVSNSVWQDMQEDKEFIYSFPHTAFQLTGEKNVIDTRLLMQFEEYVEPEQKNTDEEDSEEFEEEEEGLDDLQRFYLEKMQGNIYTDFYEDGSIKSQSEMADGIKNGKHKAFYPDGKLEAVGKFQKNNKHGIWRYYDENQKLIRKEKWKNGKLEATKRERRNA